MCAKAVKLSGAAGFDAWYSQFFADRWIKLKDALAAPPVHYEFTNGLRKPYYLDAASVLAAGCLPLSGAARILDFCAAPGGKTLVLASRMDTSAQLTANERSRERKSRLIRVLDEHLEESIRNRITVTGNDAAQWCRHEQNAYDRILLDAPCSSERHVLADPAYLALWSPARIKHLALTQWSLLSSAFLVLKEGGYLLYATCALAPQENDGVISRLVKKYASARIENCHLDSGLVCNCEKTQYGYQVLPDIHDGNGPLYFSLICKSGLKSINDIQ